MSTQTMVYQYGLLPPTLHAEEVEEQMRRAHHYRNNLVSIERGRRAALRALVTSHGSVAELEARVAEAVSAEEAAVRAIKAARAETRKRDEASSLRDTLARARVVRRDVALALRNHRKAVRSDSAIASETDRINRVATDLSANAYEHAQLYWPTRAIVDEAMAAVRKMPLYDGTKPNDPAFVRWTGEGQLGLQVHQKGDSGQGLSTKEIEQENGWLTIPQPIAGTVRKTGALRSRADRTTLRLRVGTEAGGVPLLALWPMIMHRPLPAFSIIRRLTVTRRKIGPRTVWSVEITVRLPVTAAVPVRGMIALDLGWRKIGDGVRVARWHDTNDRCGELRVQEKVWSGLEKPDALRRTRDEALNRARTELVKWMETFTTIPPWFRAATEFLSQWRSAARLAALAARWRRERWHGDKEGFETLEAWRYHDHHLWSWEASQRKKALRRRREEYRVFAAMIAKRYEYVALEEFDLRTIAQGADVGVHAGDVQAARTNRQRASVHELRLVIKNVFKGRVVEVDPAHTTTTCHFCGWTETFNAAASVHRKCPRPDCGRVWDQDANAAINILRLGESALAEAKAEGARESEKGNVSEEIKETKWARVQRLRQEKEDRQGTARELVPNRVEEFGI